ncbi:MAG: SDR family oxidoreductase [Bacteroidota bacterium]|nr:SDR family oxidoreductase [Bacteroidota bacterium]
MKEKKLTDRIAIVTGASRLKGIGAAICLSLAKEGADIFFTFWREYDRSKPWGIDENEPDILMKEIKKCGVRCEKLETDLSGENVSSLIFNEVETKLGNPLILINNAAHSEGLSIEDMNAYILDRHYKVNIRGTCLLSLEFIKRFKRDSGGRIINITSGQSRGPMIGEIAYATTKGAIDAFTLTLSAEVASKGITVNAINPGPTDTAWMSEEIKKNILPKFPMGRIGMPSDAARLVCFLASDEAEWITGQVIHSEGGFRRS